MGTEDQTITRAIIFRTSFTLRAVHLLVGGLLIVPAFVFDQSLIARWLQTLLFMGLAALTGRRVLILPNLIMLTGIVVANLLSPLGRVLFKAGPLPITLGALEDGLGKAALLIGLIYLSRLMVRDDLVLPGRFGALIAKVFRYFGLITERRGALGFRRDAEQAAASPSSFRERFTVAGERLIDRLDTLLLEVQFGGRADQEAVERVETTPGGIVLLGVIVAANWSMMLFLRFLP